MAGGWFETVAEAQRRAKKRLPSSVYSALIAGSEYGITLEDNLAAFTELGFAPHVAGLSRGRDMATTVMGQEISMPVLISPTGVGRPSAAPRHAAAVWSDRRTASGARRRRALPARPRHGRGRTRDPGRRVAGR